MTRYDKYDPISGGFRAKLAADLTLTNGSFFGLVSLNASGLVTPGTAGQSGPVGVVVKNAARQPASGRFPTGLYGNPVPEAPIGALAGDVVDVMTSGEIVDLDPLAFPAGKKVYGSSAGVISVTSAAGSILIGHTVEAGRLVVRVAQGLGTVASS